MADRAMYERGGRWWGDFRAFADVGGKREPLIPVGERRATRDHSRAERLYDARLAELRAARRAAAGQPVPGGAPVATPAGVTIREFAPEFLVLKAKESGVADTTLVRAEQALATALSCLVDEAGEPVDRPLARFKAKDAGALMVRLKTYVSPRTGKVISRRTQRYALDVLAEMYRWAAYQGHVEDGFNPVQAIPSRTTVRSQSFDFLEPDEAAAMLQALFDECGGLTPHVAASIAMAYVGARPEEAYDFRPVSVQFGKNRFRVHDSKRHEATEEAEFRYVPMVPYARAAMEAFFMTRPKMLPGALAFATEARDGQPVRIMAMPKLYARAQDRAAALLDEAGVEHALAAKHVVPRSWRTTYCTARLQTLDHGEPVAPGTVRKEMGHRTQRMIDTIYDRVGSIRERKPWVEYLLPDGTHPGEAVLRGILGGERLDEILYGARVGRPRLRVIR